MRQAGFSVRGLAAEMNRRRPRGGMKPEETWRNTLNKYKRGESLPSPATAQLLSEILGKPAGFFVRRRETVAEQRDRLLAENAELRRQLGQRGVSGSSGGQS